ncbi:MAG: hypothetical protein GYA29_00735 [Methanothrix sp.]|nr:hypothetical protein [Methanothrix sp.]
MKSLVGERIRFALKMIVGSDLAYVKAVRTIASYVIVQDAKIQKLQMMQGCFIFGIHTEEWI